MYSVYTDDWCVTSMILYVCIGVSNLGSTRTTANSITIQWGPADSPYCGPVLYYVVTIAPSENISDMIITESSESSTEFLNLMNGTLYNISVAAVNRAGTGPISTILVTTRTDDEGMYINGCS